MKHLFITLGVLGTLAVLSWFLPLFHVVAVGPANASQTDEFDAAKFATRFWAEQLVPSFDRAADAASVLSALRTSPDVARQKFGRSAGLGRATLYYLRGRGTVVSINETGVGVTLDKDGQAADVRLETKLLSGNTVRDATGLLQASDYANSQEFNEISRALNQFVEESVIAKLKQAAKVGQLVDFVGCARVVSLPGDAQPLKVIPLEIEID
jgi:predicted lipoprotein